MTDMSSPDTDSKIFTGDTKTFIEHEDIDVAFISESWERDDLTLDKIIEIEDYEVISNVSQ